MKHLLRISLFSIAISSLLFLSCSTSEKQSSESDMSNDQETEQAAADTDSGPVVLEKNGITLTEVVSPVFEGAKLSFVNQQVGPDAADGTLDFKFDVENYELGGQTSDAATKGCANSGKGQHIHLILNNEPYSAHYESNFNRTVDDGSYVALAFLSRSYHESIKSDDAYNVFSFTKGEADADLNFDAEKPHLFYSRPKGSYVGDDIKKVLLDFYLINADLSKDGHKVKATINGTEFLLDKWVPYAMEGLPAGELTVELALVDASGELVESPFNPVTRAVTLEQ